MLRNLYAIIDRERRDVLHEMIQVQGLMPLLMKPRNRQKWTRDDRQALTQYLRRLSRLSPYIMIIVLPGGFAVLPILAWWLDRRRLRRTVQVSEAGNKP
jgi:hypothetical protein